jgi:ubiquinone/menaquinone biosynthesis C-methylase UbiE
LLRDPALIKPLSTAPPEVIDATPADRVWKMLDFVQGNAENLPFPGQSFDAVMNVQASLSYPSLPRFLAEVARILRPGGHFLYADLRRRNRIVKWEEDLGNAPMRLIVGKGRR